MGNFVFCISIIFVGMLATNSSGEVEAQFFDRLTFHAKPKPLVEGAVVTDWPRFLGPLDNATSPETPLLQEWPPGGPTKVWEVAMGEGYNSPSISGDRCVIFHAIDGRETVECLDRESGKRFWVFDYPIQYQDRYGFSNGPRASPVISDDGVVVTAGVTSMLHAFELATGKVLWKIDLRERYNVPQDFFGAGSSPLILDGRVIVNVGGKASPFDESDSRKERAAKLATKGACVVAFALKTGEEQWVVNDEWGASYASPMPAALHGQTKVLVYAGGESDPAIGGLLCIDPESGELHDRFPWRDEEYIQATGSSPVVIPGKNRAFITTCYPKGRPLGGVMVEYDSDFHAKELWKSDGFAVHWMTPVYADGYLYGIDGERENNSRLVCVNAETGEEVWEEVLMWEDSELGALQGRSVPMNLGVLRASLLRVEDRFLCLGEAGTLLRLRLSPKGCEIEQRAQIFYALNTWSLPSLSHGLLYVRQQSEDFGRKSGPRVICYDLRGK